jgi:hypothetical protein
MVPLEKNWTLTVLLIWGVVSENQMK